MRNQSLKSDTIDRIHTRHIRENIVTNIFQSLDISVLSPPRLSNDYSDFILEDACQTLDLQKLLKQILLLISSKEEDDPLQPNAPTQLTLSYFNEQTVFELVFYLANQNPKFILGGLAILLAFGSRVFDDESQGTKIIDAVVKALDDSSESSEDPDLLEAPFLLATAGLGQSDNTQKYFQDKLFATLLSQLGQLTVEDSEISQKNDGQN